MTDKMFSNKKDEAEFNREYEKFWEDTDKKDGEEEANDK